MNKDNHYSVIVVPDTAKQLGKDFAKGVIWEAATVLLIVSLVIIGINFFYKAFNEIDDSDISVSERSGLKIHTDAKTGIQYFATSSGGITPRLDERGMPMRKAGYTPPVQPESRQPK
ncbi:MAG: DUF6440 family protein [Opitutaceae bacterium]|jgi:hypothetical protein|nr:DUF6440 family protein [Opitutaceae bacterium]